MHAQRRGLAHRCVHTTPACFAGADGARLSAAALVDAAPIAPRQVGAIRHLPDPPHAAFDSDRVTTSLPAYVLGDPDGASSVTLVPLALRDAND